ncbi:hypothetical protein BC938DRAFT_477069 [Jimgerdemannia flammicorona]|uniref:Uncharacterized protein n=1 Tax=Jimgerdemannia flammicorona TaxID=994334 RepID=A0A433QZ26_9FUNG|nr:hypothetical protein BC938DRAFT_477069 [Jimgerdemannia flammicorona]
MSWNRNITFDAPIPCALSVTSELTQNTPPRSPPPSPPSPTPAIHPQYASASSQPLRHLPPQQHLILVPFLHHKHPRPNRIPFHKLQLPRPLASDAITTAHFKHVLLEGEPGRAPERPRPARGQVVRRGRARVGAEGGRWDLHTVSVARRLAWLVGKFREERGRPGRHAKRAAGDGGGCCGEEDSAGAWHLSFGRAVYCMWEVIDFFKSVD